MTYSSSARSLQLPEILDLRAAGPLSAEFLAHRGNHVAVDASRVQRVGAQCVQVLLSAVATWAHDGHNFEVVKPSAEFGDGIALLGFSPSQFLQQENV
jgi:chemotaxis protein CheX